jgi:hypothetical protein
VTRRPHRLLLVAGLIAPASALAACGTETGRTALAIERTRWAGDGTLVVSTECARDLEVEVGADHGGSDLTEVTVWGRPEVGRCGPEVAVALPRDPAGRPATKIVDGATSMVVDLP